MWFYKGLREIAFYRFPNNGPSDSVTYDNTHTHTRACGSLTVLWLITQPAAIYIIPPLCQPPTVFFTDFYCPRQTHAFMWLISCKITASYFPAPLPHLHHHHPHLLPLLLLRIPSLMGAKRCKLAEREGLLHTRSPLFIVVIIIIIINARPRLRRARRSEG